jgi:Pyruvate/2-oxoglutarate dehydrogenase complex, dihydrolipoamide dehydrogenase (E3) component, and related enzymes
MGNAAQELEVDVAVIGAGTAGLVAYHQASKHTDKVVLIEGGPYGTTCARVGCMPSKLLIAAAEAAHSARHVDQFGVYAQSVRVDGKAVMERVRKERDRFVGFVLESVDNIPEDRRIRGMARFENEHTLLIDNGPRIHAGRVVIATGSRSNVVPFLNDAGSRLVTNEDLFDWEDLPESVAVFGPGLIGLEIGQALARLDVRVTMFGVSGAVGGIQDPDMRRMALETFNREFSLDPDAETTGIREVENGVEVSYRDDNGNEVSDVFEYVLAATGRRPNVDGLALENTGLALDDRGMPEFDRYTMRCGESSIFIAGDAKQPTATLARSRRRRPDRRRQRRQLSASSQRLTQHAAFGGVHRPPDCVRRLDHPANRRAVPRSFCGRLGEFRGSGPQPDPGQEPGAAASLWRARYRSFHGG